MDIVPKYEFRKIVVQYKGNYRVQKFTCWAQFLCLCFGQFTFRESLQYLTATLNALSQRLCRVGQKESEV